jgi:hypothetical protein
MTQLREQIPGDPRWQALGLSAPVQDALVGYVEGVE